MSSRIEVLIQNALADSDDSGDGDVYQRHLVQTRAVLDALHGANVSVVELPEPDDTPDVGLVIDAVTEGLREIGAVVRVAEDDDDPGCPGVLTPDGAVPLYDLNNEIATAFIASVREKPIQAREFVFALQALLMPSSPPPATASDQVSEAVAT
ncbi:hypothetical protein EB73_34885 [Mycobacterium sp. SWH-M3]|nr:hypothetical protein EB73_34885 [Mycobacterium sp. SWH-M3]